MPKRGFWVTRDAACNIGISQWNVGDTGSVEPTPMPPNTISAFHTHPPRIGAGLPIMFMPSPGDLIAGSSTHLSGIGPARSGYYYGPQDAPPVYPSRRRPKSKKRWNAEVEDAKQNEAKGRRYKST